MSANLPYKFRNSSILPSYLTHTTQLFTVVYMTAWSQKNCWSHWDQLDLHQELVTQHCPSVLRKSSPSLHHQFQLHQHHGSSCRQDRPTDMSIIAPTHVHLLNNCSGLPIEIIQCTSLKQGFRAHKIITHVSKLEKKNSRDSCAVQCKENLQNRRKNHCYVAVLYIKIKVSLEHHLFWYVEVFVTKVL